MVEFLNALIPSCVELLRALSDSTLSWDRINKLFTRGIIYRTSWGPFHFSYTMSTLIAPQVPWRFLSWLCSIFQKEENLSSPTRNMSGPPDLRSRNLNFKNLTGRSGEICFPSGNLKDFRNRGNLSKIHSHDLWMRKQRTRKF